MGESETTCAPVTAWDLTVALDYGQFILFGSVSNDSDPLLMLQEALAGQRIASDRYLVVVAVPHQNNFAMPLRVELWAGPPARDFHQWQEIFECALEVDGGEFWYASPTLESVRCGEVPDGRYAVRICGRGFVNRGWPGSTTPGDVWRVQLWPSTRNLPDRRIRAWQPPTPSAGGSGRP